ncbi:MAG TPA: AraC family transcriptional regulator ligand-binding domain-containing protein [Spongiibacteraceae bacterium]|jgi:AraC-like DNA-binding protein
MSAELLVDRYARIYIQAANTRGYDLEAIFNCSDIRPKPITDAPFSLEELYKLSRNVKLLLKDEFCGLTRSRCKLGAIQMVVDFARSAPTLIDSLEKVFGFYSLISSDIQFSIALEGEAAAICVQLAEPELDPNNFLCEWWLLNLWALSSWLIGEKIPCLRFEFPHPPEIPEAEYYQALATECRFLQSKARLLFHTEYLKRPVVKNSANLAEYASLPQKFGEIPGTFEALGPRLRGILSVYFSQYKEFPTLSYAAEQCRLTNHTLRRRLIEEGMSFNKIKDDIRRDIILKLLRAPNTSLSEITLMSGFSDPSTLGKAVKNWTGLYPNQYRTWISRSR